MLAGFTAVAKERFRLVQFIYPRTLVWNLEEYARAVDEALKKIGVRSGWVLAESYSSQVAWAWLKIVQERQTDFQFEGIILAGGFVRYPMRFNLACVRGFFAVAPWWLWRVLFWGYLKYSGFRHRNAGTEGNCAKEFVERRTPLDIAAMRARLKLIAEADWREVAARVQCPLYQLTGAIDPVVPPWPVRRWLRNNCPAYRGYRMVWPADHNVLGTEPLQALEQIMEWIGSKTEFGLPEAK